MFCISFMAFVHFIGTVCTDGHLLLFLLLLTCSKVVTIRYMTYCLCTISLVMYPLFVRL